MTSSPIGYAHMPYVIKPLRTGDGFVFEGVSGEPLSKYDLVFLSGGKWYKAAADTSATLPAFALALNEFATADYAGLFLLYGLVCNPAWTWSDGSIYASTTPGGLTQTAPSETGWVQSVGVSYGVDYMLFSPMWIKELGERSQLPIIIDVDDTEALLVRKDGDAGDVFIVDTVNGRVGIGVAPDDWLHIKGNNACLKLEDDSGNYARIKVGESQVTIEVDPDNLVASTDFVIKMDGEEVARFLVGGQFRSLESINSKLGFATRLWDIVGAVWDTTPGVNTEYYSPNQHGGIYGTVYRQYFGTTLPSSLTSGSIVSTLIDYAVQFTYASSDSDRTLAHGTAVAYGAGDSRMRINLSGMSGNGNLSFEIDTYVAVQGWVDYAK